MWSCPNPRNPKVYVVAQTMLTLSKISGNYCAKCHSHVAFRQSCKMFLHVDYISCAFLVVGELFDVDLIFGLIALVMAKFIY